MDQSAIRSRIANLLQRIYRGVVLGIIAPASLIFDFRHIFAYHFAVPRAGNTIVIAAAVIAAVRLARQDNIVNSPKVRATVSDSLTLAKMIYESAQRTYPELSVSHESVYALRAFNAWIV